MKYLFLFIIGLFIIGLLILSACQSKDITNTPVVVNNPCEDNNACTIDTKTADGECNYAIIDNCCGNKVCELNEGCNTLSKTTGCAKDCEMCPAEVKTKFVGCSGNCVVAPDSVKIKGDSILTFEVANVGEKPVTIDSEFSCSKIAEGTGKVYLTYYGLNDQSFIQRGNNNHVVLSGKTSSNFSVNINGDPTVPIILQCDAIFKDGKKKYLESIFLRLER